MITVLADYTELGLLGKGAYGHVVKCQRKVSGELCAIKKFTPNRDVSITTSFQRELEPLMRLKHANLVALFAVHIEEGHLYGVFELLDRSIADELQWTRLDAGTLQKYIFQLLCGVEFLHKNNIIHRDVKPDNLLVSRSGVVKLGDLGFSREVGEDTVGLTGSLGTIPYMAPELLVKDPNYSKAVDVWAIGCTVLCMCKNECFLYGKTMLEQLQDVVRRVGPLTQLQQQQYFARPKYAAVKLPLAALPAKPLLKFQLADRLLADLVDSCLQMDPSNRPSCSQLLMHEYFARNGFNESFAKELEDLVHEDKYGHLPQPGDQPLNSASVKAEEQEPSTLPNLTFKMRSLKESGREEAEVQAVASPSPQLIDKDVQAVESPSLRLIEADVQAVEPPLPQLSLLNRDSEDQEPMSLHTLNSPTVPVVQRKNGSFHRAARNIRRFFTCCFSHVKE